MKQEIKDRWSGKVIFVAEIDATEDTSYSERIGLAVRCAVKNNANLMRANLTDADLTRADLTRADLTCANLTRADLTDALFNSLLNWKIVKV